MKTNSRLLINEDPLQLLPSLAVLLGGSDPALILQQLHFRLKISKNLADGRLWVYNTAEQWHEKEFPWLSVKTIRRIFERLEELGLVLTGFHNRDKWDRTKWYSIDYDKLDALANGEPASGQIDHMQVDSLGTSNETDCPDDSIIQKKTPEEINASADAPAELFADELQPLQQTLGFVIAEPVESVPEVKQKEPRKSRSTAPAGYADAVRGLYESLPIKYPHSFTAKAAKLAVEAAQENQWGVDTIYDDICAAYKTMESDPYWQDKEINPTSLVKRYMYWRGKMKDKLIVEAGAPTVAYKAQPLFVKPQEGRDESERHW